MTAKEQSIPAEPQSKAAANGVAAELSEEALANLTGYFDVLIQMDLELKQRNEQRSTENERRAKNKDS